MLATLNLPFSAVELFDDPLKSSASLLPPDNANIESGFSGVLRLRVDASQAAGANGGQALPPGGSVLPHTTALGSGDASGQASFDGSLQLPQPAHAPVEGGSMAADAAQAMSLQAAATGRLRIEAVGVFAAAAAAASGDSPGQVSVPAELLRSPAVLAPAPAALPVIPVAGATASNGQPGTAAGPATTPLQAPDSLAEHPATAAALPDVLARLTAQDTAEPQLEPLATPAGTGTAEAAVQGDAPDVSLIAAVNYPAAGEAGLESTNRLTAAQSAVAQHSGDAKADSATASQASVDNRSVEKSVLPPPYANTLAVAARADELLHADAGRQAPSLAIATLKELSQGRTQESHVSSGRQATTVVEARPSLEPSRQPGILPLLNAGGDSEAFADIDRVANKISPPAQRGHVALPPLPAAALGIGSVAAGDPGSAAIVQQASDLIGSHVRDPAWGERVAERVLMMASNQLKTAEIRLTPAELGPLRVQVALDDGAAHVTFHAQHALTRDAIEQALPRLREMLAENGIALGQADVAERGVGEGHQDGEGSGERADSEADASYDGDPVAGQASQRRPSVGLGLVDTFA